MAAPVAAPKPEAKKAEPKKAEFAIVDSFDESERGAGGFGSSGHQ